MSRTYTRLPLAEGIWQSNFIAIPAEFAQAIRSSPEFATQGVVALRLNWTGPKENATGASTETESKECYVGWNGAIARGPYLQVPDRLSQLTGLATALQESRARGGNGLIINVYAIKSCEIAKRVDVEPETVEDWEVLERHAGFVETQMLSQICVVYPNQRFCVWVANVPVKLVVKGGVPTPCVKMANETEVIVAPKPRPQQQQQSAQTIGNSQAAGPAATSTVQGRPVTLRVQHVEDSYVGCVLVSRGTLELMRTVAEWDATGEDRVGLSGGPAISGTDPSRMVLCRLAAMAGEEDGPVYSVRISDRIAHGHVGVSRSSRRSSIKVFSKVNLFPVASTDLSKVVSPSPITLRRIVFPSAPSSSSSSIVEPLSAKLSRVIINPDFTVLSPGSWINVEGTMFKLISPQGTLKTAFWKFNPDTQWTEGEDLILAASSSSNGNGSAQNEEKEDSSLVGDDLETDFIDAPSVEDWTLQTIGGPCKKAGEDLKEHLFPLLSTTGSANRVRLGTSPTGGCYLFGPRGSGKTTLLRALARTLGEDPNFLTFVVRVDCAALKGGKRSAIQKKFEKAVALAQSRSPSLVVFEDLDALLPQPANPGEEDAQTVWLSEFLENSIRTSRAKFERFEKAALEAVEENRIAFADVVNWNRNAVGFMATGRAKKSLRSALLRVGCFEKKIEMPLLDLSGRQSVLRALLLRRDLLREVVDDEIEEVATKAEGYTAADLDTLVERAVHAQASLVLEEKQDHHPQLLLSAIDGFTPSSLRGVKLAKSDTAWSDVGGLQGVRDILKETLELPFQFAELYDRSPQKLASGILLYGPPGCGKTLLAGAVASECGLNFISVKGPEVLNKYIGASEQAIRDLFARAASVTPCIIFFDEFDAVAPRRGSDSTGVTDRVVNQLLTFLDGVESRKGVYVMAATSRPDLVDPALLRPGRLDKQLYCGFPDEEERLSILQAIAGKLKLASDAWAEKLPVIAHTGKQLTGADLQALLATAQLLAVHDESPEITSKHLERAFADTRPSVSMEDRARLERIYRQFRGDREAPGAPDDGAGFFSPDGKQKVALM